MSDFSHDLLYIILSLAIVWVTVFFCWLIYQAARVLRNANRIIENVSEKVELAMAAIEFIRKKVDTVSNSMGSISSLVTGLVERFVVHKLTGSLEDRLQKRKRKKKSD